MVDSGRVSPFEQGVASHFTFGPSSIGKNSQYHLNRTKDGVVKSNAVSRGREAKLGEVLADLEEEGS